MLWLIGFTLILIDVFYRLSVPIDKVLEFHHIIHTTEDNTASLLDIDGLQDTDTLPKTVIIDNAGIVQLSEQLHVPSLNNPKAFLQALEDEDHVQIFGLDEAFPANEEYRIAKPKTYKVRPPLLTWGPHSGEEDENDRKSFDQEVEVEGYYSAEDKNNVIVDQDVLKTNESDSDDSQTNAKYKSRRSKVIMTRIVTDKSGKGVKKKKASEKPELESSKGSSVEENSQMRNRHDNTTLHSNSNEQQNMTTQKLESKHV